MAEPLTPEREQEIRETHPGEWYDGPWTQDDVDAQGDEVAYCRVIHHQSGTTLATLPDFAGPIALFIADAHEAVPELLAEIERLRNELDETAAALHSNRERRIKAEVDRDAFRSEVLNEGADAIVAENDRMLWATKPGSHWAADLLRRMAPAAPAPPVPDNTTGDEGEYSLEYVKGRCRQIAASLRAVEAERDELKQRLGRATSLHTHSGSKPYHKGWNDAVAAVRNTANETPKAGA